MTKKILFLGETYRADALTWMNGLKEFGSYEIYTWELEKAGQGFNKIKRALEMIIRLRELKRMIIDLNPDLIIAERITSYGFIGALFHRYAPIVVAQQGISDIYPQNKISTPIKEITFWYACKHATLIHAWGEIMSYDMLNRGTTPNKILVMAKGIDLRNYNFQPYIKDNKIRAIITRSLSEDYRHETILRAFEIIKQKYIPFELTIIGDGPLKEKLMQSAIDKNIHDEVIFEGRITNIDLPKYLSVSDLYISMPCTEGVSASLFEAMAAGCYPIVTNLPGNSAWIIDKINGRLVSMDDSNQLADAIQWYSKTRNTLYSGLVRNRKTVELKASYEKNMKFISNKYHEIINKTTLCVE